MIATSTPAARPRALVAAALLVATVAATLLAARSTAANATDGRYVVGASALLGTVYDAKTKLTWQRAVPATQYAWADAKATCAALTLDGSGWRLPTLRELSSLIDFSKLTGPYIDTSAFPGTPSNPFWTATPLASAPTTSAWPVFFDLGAANASSQTSQYYVRCVR